MQKQYVRRPMVSDAPAELQMQFSSYLNSTSEPLPFDVWNTRRLEVVSKTTTSTK